MGSEYVAIWAKCQHKISRKFFESIMQDKKLLGIFICLLAMIGSAIVIEIESFFAICETHAIVAFVVLVLASIASVVLTKFTNEKDPVKRFQTRRRNSQAIMQDFLLSTGLTHRDLPNVLISVKRYRDDKKADRATFMNRAFTILISGVFMMSLGWLFESYKNSEIAYTALSASICVLSIATMPLAGAIWEVHDTFRQASLTKAESMIAALECKMN